MAAQIEAGAKVVTSTYNEPLITAEWAAAVFAEQGVAPGPDEGRPHPAGQRGGLLGVADQGTPQPAFHQPAQGSVHQREGRHRERPQGPDPADPPPTMM